MNSREAFTAWALVHHSMRDREWFIHDAENGILPESMPNSWGAWQAATERAARLAHNKALHCEDHDNPYGQGAALDIEDAIRG